MYSNVTTSTRINSSSVHTYIFVCSTLRVSNKGLLTQNATCIIEYCNFRDAFHSGIHGQAQQRSTDLREEKKAEI